MVQCSIKAMQKPAGTANGHAGLLARGGTSGQYSRMTYPFAFRRVAAVMLVLLAALPALARQPHTQSDSGGFDYFLLSLSIAPSFCALSPANQAKQECQTLTEADFRETPLTVHGLWPNRAGVSVNLQPHDCEGPPLGPLPEATAAELRRYMPGGPGLARYEWRKHGACSGMSPESYFAAVADLARKANATIGAAMREQGMLGQRLRIADLLSAVASRDEALAQAIVVDCRQPRGGGEALVDEIRIVLTKDLRPMPAGSVGLGQNSGCPRGAGLVPDATR
jgi:ribonuclease T2